MNNLLEGTKILIIADSIASLMTAKIFHFLGATVNIINNENSIKITLKIQDNEILYWFLVEDLNVIDLSIKDDSSELSNYLKQSDIFIYSKISVDVINETFGSNELRKLFPSLIIGIESPFGLDGKYSDWQTNEIIDFAMGGYMQFCGASDKEPLMIKGYQAELHSGLQLAYATLASYWHKIQKNNGEIVEVSRMESMLNAQVWFVPRWLQEGYAWSREPSILIPCKNGYIIWGLQTPEIFLLIERIDLYEDPQYRTAQGWNEGIVHVKELLREWCLSHTKEEIYENAQSLRITITPVNNIEDILSSEQFAYRNWWENKKHDEHGTIKTPSAPWKIKTGEDITSKKNDSFNDSEPALPLKGVKVLEVTNNWAGPHAGRMLADLGADVIIIERNHVQVTRSKHLFGGDDNFAPNFYNRAHPFNQLNRNKKGVVVDLSKEEGKNIFFQLAKDSDIIIENNSSRVFPNFGISFEEIKKHNPSIILCSISGFGATGPQANHVALGSNLEGSSGLVSTIGYDKNNLSESGGFYADPIGGSFGAIVSIASLIAKRQNNHAIHIDISLLESVALFLIDGILSFQKNNSLPKIDGNTSEFNIPQGAYQTGGKDCWLALSIENDNQWLNFCLAINDKELMKFNSTKLRKINIKKIEDAINAWAKTTDHYEAANFLQSKGVPAGPILSNWEVASDPHLFERNYWLHNVHAVVGYQKWDGYPWRISKNWKMLTVPAPLFGEHNTEILNKAGFSDKEINQFIKKGVIANIPADLNMYIDKSK